MVEGKIITVIYKKLKNIGKWINLEIPNCEWKICVDPPLLESIG